MAVIPFYSSVSSDFARMHKSKRFLASQHVGTSGVEYGLIRVPPRTFVPHVWVFVETAFDGVTPASATVGFIGNAESADPDAFITNTVIALATAGMKQAGQDTAAWSEGKYFVHSGGITMTYTANNSVNGSLIIFAEMVAIV